MPKPTNSSWLPALQIIFGLTIVLIEATRSVEADDLSWSAYIMFVTGSTLIGSGSYRLLGKKE